MNTVQSLKEMPWSRLSLQQKLEVKRLGPDRPDLKPYQTTTRKFSADWYSKHDWLTGCLTTMKVYCFPCMLFGQSDKEVIFSKTGLDDWNHLSQTVKKHSECKHHANNVCSLALFHPKDSASE